MPEKKMNWGTLILGIIIGAVVVGVVWMAQKPATTGAGMPDAALCVRQITSCIEGNALGGPVDCGQKYTAEQAVPLIQNCVGASGSPRI